MTLNANFHTKQVIKFVIAFGLLTGLAAKSAYADCFNPYYDNASYSISIEKSFAPVFDGRGEPQPGCILKSGGKIIGYTAYNYICRLDRTEKILVRLGRGCCDTGPDAGDLGCTVRVKNAFGFKVAHGNGDVVFPIQKDVRALDDLVETLKGNYFWSYATLKFA